MAVSSQQDADSLRACARQGEKYEYDGNIVITPDASGDLDFRGHGDINGVVMADNNPLLKTLRFDHRPALDGPVSGFILKNLSSFVSLSSDVRVDADNLSLEALPLLETVNLPTSSIYGDIRLSKLPRLKALQDLPKYGLRSKFIDIRDVGLNSLDSFFEIGYWNVSIFVAGIPNINSLSYSLFSAKTVSISGNGNLSLVFNCSWCGDEGSKETRTLSTQYLTVSGLSSISRNYDHQGRVYPTLTVGSLRAVGNSFKTLDIDFADLKNLTVQDNPNLEGFRFNGNASNYSWSDIVITGNPKLRLNSSANIDQTGAIFNTYPTFFWPANDTSSMVFQGAFSNEFL